MKQDKTYIFKPRRISKRLLLVKKELEKDMTIDHIKRIIEIDRHLNGIDSKGVCYSDCLILEKFYQRYLINVKGRVNLDHNSLIKLPKILFNKVEGYFSCSYNKLISLRNSPSIVTGDFYCDNNNIISLEGCPIEVEMFFNIECNDGKVFSKKEISSKCL